MASLTQEQACLTPLSTLKRFYSDTFVLAMIILFLGRRI